MRIGRVMPLQENALRNFGDINPGNKNVPKALADYSAHLP
jgi:hypothetical protein